MEPHFDAAWKELDIFDAIKLSTIEIIIDREFLMAALSFWCSATNTMILPLGPIGPIGTSLTSLLIDTILSGYQFNLDLKTIFEERAYDVLKKKDQEVLKEEVSKLHKNFFNYSMFITHFAGQDVSRNENMKLSCFIGTRNSSFVPSQTSTSLRTCRLLRL